MDIFVEEMVAKRKTGIYFAKTIGLVALCFALVSVLLMVGTTLIPSLAPFIFMVAAGCVYGAYLLISGENVEYEYSLVNNEIDVDKIISQRKRKRLTTANIRELESFGTKANPDYEKYRRDPVTKKIYACEDKKADDVFFLVYTENTVKKMLIFSPSKNITDVIAKYNPKKAMI